MPGSWHVPPQPGDGGEMGRSVGLPAAEWPVGIHSPPEPRVLLLPGCIPSLGSLVRSRRNLVTR